MGVKRYLHAVHYLVRHVGGLRTGVQVKRTPVHELLPVCPTTTGMCAFATFSVLLGALFRLAAGRGRMDAGHRATTVVQKIAD